MLTKLTDIKTHKKPAQDKYMTRTLLTPEIVEEDN